MFFLTALALLFSALFLPACAQTVAPALETPLPATATPTPVAVDATPTPEPTPTPTPEPPPATPEPRRATLAFVGDLICFPGQASRARVEGGGYDFSPNFAAVRELLSEADFAAGNLEVLISPEHMNTEQKGEGLPSHAAPAEFAIALREAGFDYVATANNHSIDWSGAGVRNNIAHLDAIGLLHSGTYASPEEQRHAMAMVNGIPLALLSYTSTTNGGMSVSAEEKKYMLAKIDAEAIRTDIAAAKEDGAEFVIVYMHWGKDGSAELQSKQKEYAQTCADAGADIIIGSHPHLLQVVRMVTAADGRKVPCFYSLGNFLSSQSPNLRKDTGIARCVIEEGPDGIYITEWEFIPCRIGEFDGVSYSVYPVPPDSAEAQRIWKQLQWDAFIESMT